MKNKIVHFTYSGWAIKHIKMLESEGVSIVNKLVPMKYVECVSHVNVYLYCVYQNSIRWL